MIKKWIYSKFANYYAPNTPYPVLELAGRLFEKYLGYATFDYGKIKLTAAPYALLDWYIIQGININPYVTSALTQFLKDGGVFLDIGANHGVFSLLAACNPNTSVFAFEPSPRELSRLWKNIEINQLPNISVLPFGLSDKNHRQTLNLNSDDNPGKNSTLDINEKSTQVICPFIPIGELLSKDVLQQARVCKLDIEGQEMFVLNSLKPYMHLLQQCVFVIEMSPLFLEKAGHSVEDIYSHFKHYGFKHQYGYTNNMIQWEEFFYHPDQNPPLKYMEDF